jgi:hypothetical protein
MAFQYPQINRGQPLIFQQQGARESASLAPLILDVVEAALDWGRLAGVLPGA